MPFPLAHPAAVLPLKRYCPQRLSFSALVIGAVCPDVGYLFSRYKADELAHTLWGGLVFDLPVGLLMLAVFFLFRERLVQLLPDPLRPNLLPLCRKPVGPFPMLVLSLVIGILTHLAWDSFTHKNSWLIRQFPSLQYPIVRIIQYHVGTGSILGDRSFRVCTLLSYLSSFCGTALVCYEYQRWLAGVDASIAPFSNFRAWRNALIAGGLLLPLDIFHHLAKGGAMLVFTAVWALLLMVGFLWLAGRPAQT